MLLADTHVHYYDHYDATLFFSSALKNFDLLRRQFPITPTEQPSQFLLCLTEKADCHFFERCVGNEIKIDGGTFSASSPDQILISFTDNSGKRIHLVRGFQTVTAERVEVLLLGSDQRIPDGESLDATIKLGLKNSAAVVLPWSLGKWTGKRYQVIAQAVKDFGSQLCLGDIPMLPAFCPKPSLLRTHSPILAGSDPLPLANEEMSVASFCSYFPGSTVSSVESLEDLKKLLHSNPITVGKRNSWFGTLQRSIKLRM